MNSLMHLNGFFAKAANDLELKPTHISLYLTLFRFWAGNNFKNPINITRNEVMHVSRISANATYHKCLKELHSSGYIKYKPSFNPFRGSEVSIIDFNDDI